MLSIKVSYGCFWLAIVSGEETSQRADNARSQWPKSRKISSHYIWNRCGCRELGRTNIIMWSISADWIYHGRPSSAVRQFFSLRNRQTHNSTSQEGARYFLHNSAGFTFVPWRQDLERLGQFLRFPADFSCQSWLRYCWLFDSGYLEFSKGIIND